MTRGYSLIELLVAVGLGTLLLGGAAVMMQLSHRSFRAASAEAQAVRDGLRIAGAAERLLEGARGVVVAGEDEIVFWRARAVAPVVGYREVPPQLLVHLLDGPLPEGALTLVDGEARAELGLAAPAAAQLLLTDPLPAPPGPAAWVGALEIVRVAAEGGALVVRRCPGVDPACLADAPRSEIGDVEHARFRYFPSGEAPVRVELELEHAELPVVVAAPLARGGP